MYKISSVGTVAGCYVLDGKLARNAKIRVVRDGIVVAEDEMSSLKRFKDDAKEVAKGYECGVTLEKFASRKAISSRPISPKSTATDLHQNKPDRQAERINGSAPLRRLKKEAARWLLTDMTA